METLMGYFMRMRQYAYYKWVYIIGTILMLVNGMSVENNRVLHFSLAVLYGILLYKGMHIIACYKKAEIHSYQKINKKQFIKTYGAFRMKVLLFWLAFIVLCIIGKVIFKIEQYYFYSCTFFFLLLDRIFVNEGCLLQKISDPKGKVVSCCCGCPCRGWDLMMIHTPLLFAMNHQNTMENFLICLSSAMAISSIIYWEKEKYSLVEVRKKCAKPCDLRLCREHRKKQGSGFLANPETLIYEKLISLQDKNNDISAIKKH